MNLAHSKLGAAIVGVFAASSLHAASQQTLPAQITNTTWRVTDCTDNVGSTASLRYFATAPATHSGDKISLSECSPGTITLLDGQIQVVVNDLEIIGVPGLVVSAGNNSRVFSHTGTGALALSDIALSDGKYFGSTTSFGGCITSNGSVALTHVSIAHCAASTISGVAKGGAVFAAKGVTMVSSVISGSEVSGRSANGGGVYSHGLTALYSTISYNAAHSDQSAAQGGGAYIVASTSGAQIAYSTIDHNQADYSGGGLQIFNANTKISNTTISYNRSPYFGGGIFAEAPNVVIRNSTIVLNHCDGQSGDGGGIFFDQGNMTLDSSIVSLNTKAGGDLSDILVGNGGVLSGASNEISSFETGAPPAGFISVADPPLLTPLTNHGGSTQTHMLLAGSPGRGHGNNAGLFGSDQRGRGYRRDAGRTVDIGAVQFDTIFVGNLELNE